MKRPGTCSAVRQRDHRAPAAAMRCLLLMRMLTSGAKTHRMCARFLAALLLLSCIFAVVAARAVGEDTGVGPPLALVPEAPPLPKPGPLSEPRLSTHVGFHGFDQLCYLAIHAQTGQTRTGPEAVLRASALRRRHGRLRYLPRSGAGLHRWQTRVSRHPWPRRPTQRPNGVECAL